MLSMENSKSYKIIHIYGGLTKNWTSYALNVQFGHDTML